MRDSKMTKKLSALKGTNYGKLKERHENKLLSNKVDTLIEACTKYKSESISAGFREHRIVWKTIFEICFKT